jgi:UPF0716 protein FxsA
MSLVKWAFIALLLLPAAEIGIVILVALLIGWLWTIILFLATSAAGVILLRRSGRSDLDRARAAFAKDGFRAVHLEMPGFAPIVGGILLVFPGFITDLLGLALLVPRFRRWASARLRQAARQPRRSRPGEITVIDLAPNEWQQITDGRPKTGPKNPPRSPPKNPSTSPPENPPTSRRRKSRGGE